MEKVRVRIAPSPTGSIHVGLARTALYNYLFARQHNGAFVLRIEDTDEKRNLQVSEQQILDGFRWLGMHWDEGPDCGGAFGPYRQSERIKLYEQYLQILLGAQKAYWCYCTQEELADEREQQERAGKPPVYSQRCRHASNEQIAEWKLASREPILRFATNNETIVVHDMVHGDVTFHASAFGDFSIARVMTSPLYNFAVVVDDALMQITHVIRGEEHLSNTPKQILLYQALGFALPQFAHLPLLVGPDRKKLSKRAGATSIEEYREAGFFPKALVNFLALLGWHPKDDREIFSLAELSQIFRLDDVQKAGALFDEQKLHSMNGIYLRSLTPSAIIAEAGERLGDISVTLGSNMEAAIQLAKERATTLNDIADSLQFLLALPEYEPALLLPKKNGTTERTKEALTMFRLFFGSYDMKVVDAPQLKKDILALLQEKKYSTTESLWPLRVALSGLQFSPDVFDIAALMSKEEILRRLNVADQKLAELAKTA